MPSRQSPAQKKTVRRVMHEYKHGELKTARGKRKVKNPKQAIAIALSETSASKYDTPKERSRNLRRTKSKERRGATGQAAAEGRGRSRRSAAKSSRTTRTSRSTARRSGGRRAAGGKTRAELYAEARRRDIPGRSKMNKAQLQRALS